MFDVLTCGEPMVLFSPATPGPLRHVASFTKHVAGAELNFSVALTRLGLRVGYLTHVGEDEFGRYILASMRAEGLDTSLVTTDPSRRTGVYFKEHRGLGDPQVYYYREGSAASALGPTDLRPDLLAGVRLVHVTGITPLLSESCWQATDQFLDGAKAAGVAVSFDPNIRLKLIPRPRVAEVMMTFVRRASVLLLNESELEMLFGTRRPAAVRSELKGAGPSLLVVKRGADGATATDLRGGKTVEVAPFRPTRYVDPVGAGDGFDAGFIFGYLQGWPLEDSLRLGNHIGALATTVAGDYEAYPLYGEIDAAGLVPRRAGS